MAVRIFPTSQNNNAIHTPTRLDENSLNRLLATASRCMSSNRFLTFDLSNLHFIEPIGVAALTCLGEYALTNWSVRYNGLDGSNDALSYLHAVQYTNYIRNQAINSHPNPYQNYIPLNVFREGQYNNFLYNELAPWLEQKLNLHPETTESIRVNLEEAYLNIRHHSGVKSGCTVAQFYPKLNLVRFAIADWGKGIPARVREFTKGDKRMSDADLLWKACQHGFSSKSVEGNRGYGLFNLTKYFVKNNGGSIFLKSGLGELIIKNDGPGAEPKLYQKNVAQPYKYYGTLLGITLRTDNLIDGPMEREDLEWT